VVEHPDGHNFALGYFARMVTVLLSVFGQTGYFCCFFLKFFAEIVCNTKDFRNFVCGKQAHDFKYLVVCQI
jgi:hypothetical protein